MSRLEEILAQYYGIDWVVCSSDSMRHHSEEIVSLDILRGDDYHYPTAALPLSPFAVEVIRFGRIIIFWALSQDLLQVVEVSCPSNFYNWPGVGSLRPDDVVYTAHTSHQ